MKQNPPNMFDRFFEEVLSEGWERVMDGSDNGETAERAYRWKRDPPTWFKADREYAEPNGSNPKPDDMGINLWYEDGHGRWNLMNGEIKTFKTILKPHGGLETRKYAGTYMATFTNTFDGRRYALRSNQFIITQIYSGYFYARDDDAADADAEFHISDCLLRTIRSGFRAKVVQGGRFGFPLPGRGSDVAEILEPDNDYISVPPKTKKSGSKTRKSSKPAKPAKPAKTGKSRKAKPVPVQANLF